MVFARSARLLKCSCAKEFFTWLLKLSVCCFFVKNCGCVSCCNWVGAAAERRRFFASNATQKIFSQKKSRIDDEAKTRIRGTRFLCPPQFEPVGVRSGAQLCSFADSLKVVTLCLIITKKEVTLMSYAFSTEKVGSVKLQNFHHSFSKNLVLAGIDGQTNDANTVINGINQLLSIVNFQNEYNPEDAIRTVIQSVHSQE